MKMIFSAITLAAVFSLVPMTGSAEGGCGCSDHHEMACSKANGEKCDCKSCDCGDSSKCTSGTCDKDQFNKQK